MIKYLVVCALFTNCICCASKQQPGTVNVTTANNITTPKVKVSPNVTLSEVKKAISEEQLVLPTDPPKENITLAELDVRITRAIARPKRDPDMGLQLLKDTFFYYSEVDDIADLFVQDYFDGMEAINASGVRVKPKFIELEYDEKKLQDIYSWDEKDVDELSTNLGGCKYVWERVQRLLAETPEPTTTTTTTTTTVRTTTTVTTPTTPVTVKVANFTEISAETVEFSEVSASKEEAEENTTELPKVSTTKKKKSKL